MAPRLWFVGEDDELFYNYLDSQFPSELMSVLIFEDSLYGNECKVSDCFCLADHWDALLVAATCCRWGRAIASVAIGCLAISRLLG